MGMKEVAQQIAAALAAQEQAEEEERRLVHRRELREIIKTIPNGTHDNNLTPEQRQAWDEYESLMRRV